MERLWICATCGKEEQGTTLRLPPGWVGEEEPECKACRQVTLDGGKGQFTLPLRGRR